MTIWWPEFSLDILFLFSTHTNEQYFNFCHALFLIIYCFVCQIFFPHLWKWALLLAVIFFSYFSRSSQIFYLFSVESCLLFFSHFLTPITLLRAREPHRPSAAASYLSHLRSFIDFQPQHVRVEWDLREFYRWENWASERDIICPAWQVRLGEGPGPDLPTGSALPQETTPPISLHWRHSTS